MAENVRHYEFYKIIIDKIKTGEIKNGEKLPTERSLSDMYNISRTTIREALKNLEHDGYIIRKQGSGNFVKLRPIQQNLIKLYTLRNLFKEQGIKHSVHILEFEFEIINEKEAEKLQLNPGDMAIRLVRLFLAADVPYSIEYTYLPLSIFKDLTKEMIMSSSLYLSMEKLGLKPTSAVEKIQVTQITDTQKRLLKLVKKEFVIQTERIAKSKDIVVEHTINIIKNEYFVYTVELS